ncbi:MAG: FxSxx-COOH system tetratricopeptide repeat protein [Acidobacteriota bacterium]|nr:FxSxx-COOH system tetratricopeptide repeat protein [Acidobacteriota bacterium]
MDIFASIALNVASNLITPDLKREAPDFQPKLQQAVRQALEQLDDIPEIFRELLLKEQSYLVTFLFTRIVRGESLDEAAIDEQVAALTQGLGAGIRPEYQDELQALTKAFYQNLREALAERHPAAEILIRMQEFKDILQTHPTAPVSWTPRPPPKPGVIPDYGLLHPHSYMPFAINANFVGRADDLLWLHRCLKKNSSIAVGQVVNASGLGGIGKTQLAVEYVHRFGPCFPNGVFWLNFSDPEVVPSEISRVGRNMDLHPRYLDLPLDQQVSTTLKAWRQGTRLLVFDNCEDETLFQRWRPGGSDCRILLTSRRQRWSQSTGIQRLALGLLERPQSVELLAKLCPGLDAVVADRIAGELGDLPLALHLAGSYLHHFRDLTAPEAYLAELEQSSVDHASLEGKGTFDKPTDHDMHLARTFRVSFEELNGLNGAAARALLTRAACLAPGEPIDRAMLLSLTGEPTPELVEGLTLLVDLGLLEPAEGKLILHRLLAAFVIHETPDLEQRREEIGSRIVVFAHKINEHGIPGRMSDTLPHLSYLADISENTGLACYADLAHELGHYFQLSGNFQTAKKYLRAALASDRKSYELGHPKIAARQSNLALVLQDFGEFWEARGLLRAARDLLRAALVSDQQSYEPGHPDIAKRQSNLAMVLKDLGELSEARDLLRAALASDRKSYGSGHPDIATRQSNLAMVLKDLGELTEARNLLRASLASDQQSYEPGHPNIARGQSNLAVVLRGLGELSEARDLLRAALASDQQSYEPGHPTIASGQSNLAMVLQDLGELSEARDLLRAALASDQKSYEPGHPNIATRKSNLAMVLKDLGELSEARDLLRAALVSNQNSYKPSHPNIAKRQSNLAMVLKDLGELSEARNLLEHALWSFRNIYGPDHMYSRIVQHNLDNLGDAGQ